MIETFSYSVELAKKIGPLSSIYLSVLNLMCIYQHEFTISATRNDIYNLSGIEESKQLEIEMYLTKLNILSVKPFRGSNEKNHYTINYLIIKNIINQSVSTIETLDSIKASVVDKKKKTSKKESKIDRLKKSISVDDTVVKQNLCDWIDSVIEKGGYLTTQSVKINIDELTKFSSNKDIQNQVIKMATKNCWRDLSWAMDRLKNQNKIFSESSNNFEKYSNIKGSQDDLVNEAF